MKSQRNSILQFLSFVALILFACLLICDVLAANGILELDGIVMRVLRTVQYVSVLVVIGINAYGYASSRGKAIRITFWVAVVIFVVAAVLTWIKF